MPRLTDIGLQTALAALPGWAVEDGELVASFVFRDFVEALGFIAQVGALQEQANHHATLTNTYAKVAVALSTHDEGGITGRDTDLAAKITERAARLLRP